jgi:exodeoxyribonuclease VII small subunit
VRRARSAGALPRCSFERSIQRLGAIVESLEEGDQPLEESIALFEEGMALAKSSQDILDRAERRIEELLGVDAQGKPIVREIDPTDGRDGARGSMASSVRAITRNAAALLIGNELLSGRWKSATWPRSPPACERSASPGASPDHRRRPRRRWRAKCAR